MEPFDPTLDLSNNKTSDFVCFVDTRIVVRENNKIKQLQKQYNDLLRRKEYLEAIKRYYINPKPSVSPLNIENSVASDSKGVSSSLSQDFSNLKIYKSFGMVSLLKKYNVSYAHPIGIIPKKKYVYSNYHCKMGKYDFDGDQVDMLSSKIKSEPIAMAAFEKTLTQLQNSEIFRSNNVPTKDVYIPRPYESEFDGDQLNLMSLFNRKPINQSEEIPKKYTINYCGDDEMLDLLNLYFEHLWPGVKVVHETELSFDENSSPMAFDIEI